MVLLLAFAPVFSSWLNAPEAAFDLTVTYVRICGAGIVFVVAYNVISGIFRGLGNSRLPLIFVAIACVTNIIGDLLFVAVFHMNVAGAALATILAQAVSVVLSWIIIRRQNLPFTMSRKDIGFHREILFFLQTGVPIAFQELLTNISFLILCAIINGIGLEASSGYIAKSAEYLRGFSPEAILTCVVFSFIGFFNGHGRTMPVMFQGITASFLVRVPLSYLFSLKPDATLVDIGLAVPVASVYGILFFSVCYLFYLRSYRTRLDKQAKM